MRGVPIDKLEKGRGRALFTIAMTPSMKAALIRLAKDEGTTVNDLIRKLLIERLPDHYPKWPDILRATREDLGITEKEK